MLIDFLIVLGFFSLAIFVTWVCVQTISKNFEKNWVEKPKKSNPKNMNNETQNPTTSSGKGLDLWGIVILLVIIYVIYLFFSDNSKKDECMQYKSSRVADIPAECLKYFVR